MVSSTYQKDVADYYDHEACNYEERYWKNHVAQRIRQSFREVVKDHPFRSVLEVGCGTGLDLAHFGSIFPDREVFGIDISPAMIANSAKKIQELGLQNVRVRLGAPEHLPELFPEVQFDHIYVFFGALNTVTDLPHVAKMLKGRLKPGGTMVLTFVNKWYLVETLINLLLFRPKRAIMRFRATWSGYSDRYHLESRCFSPHEIQQAFNGNFKITSHQGYSILYPAWYRVHWARRLGRRLCDALWTADRFLNRTPAWCLGEYALYALKARN